MQSVSSASAQSTASGTSGEAAPSASREDVQALIDEALSKTYTNVTFAMETDTSATATVEGQMQQQTMYTSVKGEIDKGSDPVRMHMKFESYSNTAPGKTLYDMFVNGDEVIIQQGEDLFSDSLGDGGAAAYAESLTAVTSSEEISNMLDVAKNFKVEESDAGDTTITVTVDVNRLSETNLVDESSLPEGSSIATLVASYTLDTEHRFKSIRLMSSTAGTPTYRVSQMYRFSDYDATTLPEWPDLKAYIAKMSGIETDAEGRMYIVEEDGTILYVEGIDDDGMIHISGTS